MKIDIGDDWTIESDAHCFILRSKYKKKSGEDAWRNAGYYSSLESAAKGLVLYDVLKSDAYGVRAIIDRINEAEENIIKAFNEFGDRS